MHSLETIKTMNEQFAKKELERKQMEKEEILKKLETLGYMAIPLNAKKTREKETA